ncbi:uncharacterized protein LOC144124150 [Amblyomma americanum]
MGSPMDSTISDHMRRPLHASGTSGDTTRLGYILPPHARGGHWARQRYQDAVHRQSFLASCAACANCYCWGGDIEANPGPDTAQILTQLQEIASDIKEIKEKRLADIDNKLAALARLEKQVTSCQEQVAQMSEVIERLEERIDDLDNRSRRCNLIVYGLSESEEETKETFRERVNKDIVQDKLDLDAVAIERIHRLGQPAGNKIRPVIMKLLDYREKESILKRGFKLKNSDLSIGEDFSRKIRYIRKKLWDSAKPNRDNGDKVSLSFNKLYINGQAFVWDSENAVKVPFGKKNDKATTPERQNDNVSSPRMTRRRAHSKK